MVKKGERLAIGKSLTAEPPNVTSVSGCAEGKGLMILHLS